MAAIDGTLLVLKTDASGSSTTIGGLLSNSLNFSADEIEITSKDSGGDKDYLAGERSATLDFEINFDTAASEGIEDLYDDYAAGGVVAWIFGGTTGGDTVWSGDSIITSLSISAPENDRATASGTLRVKGAVTKGTVGT